MTFSFLHAADLHLGSPLRSLGRSLPASDAKRIRSQLGWRLAGTYVPGVLAAGWYTVKGQRAKRQLWSVYRDSDVLVIETTRSSPSRIVLQHPDRAMLADRINAIRQR